jgi:hypothetical protein
VRDFQGINYSTKSILAFRLKQLNSKRRGVSQYFLVNNYAVLRIKKCVVEI